MDSKTLYGYRKLIALSERAFDPQRRIAATQPLAEKREEVFMMQERSGNPLIAISVERIQDAPYIGPDGHLCKTADIRGVSKNQRVSFRMTTGLLGSEQIRRCELLKRHGSTVVEVPLNWESGYYGPGGWHEVVIKQAMDRMAQLYEGQEETLSMSVYDPELAATVLAKLNENFPFSMSDHELKHAIIPEPSSDVLFTALEGLRVDGLVEGIGLRGGVGRHNLVAIANIKISGEGRRRLEDEMRRKTAKSNQTFHVNEASAFILKQLFAEFRERRLTSDDLRNTYQGLPPAELKQSCIAEGISEVDYDLAMSDLDTHDLVKTGPQELYKNEPGSSVTIIAFYSKNEFSYLTENGYREAGRLGTTPAKTARSGLINV